MIRAVTMANMKPQIPGGPSLKGHVRLGCDVRIALSSAAKAGEIKHDKASKGPKRFGGRRDALEEG